ncbi:MAG: hypothetical protein LBO20_08790, partial [Bifidobacteriaceae bacterium]|nr:hypothetical protein [Bifidobacteriaceae bacterium]
MARTMPSGRLGGGRRAGGMSAAVAPLSARFVVLAAVASGAAVALGSASLLSWGPLRWVEVSAAFRQALGFGGPVAALVGCYSARVFHSVVCGVAPGRGVRAVARRHLGVLGVAVGLGYVAGLAPVVGLATAKATAGGPDLLVMASGLALAWAWLAAGFLLGALVRFPFSLIGWVLLCLGVLWLPLAAAHLASGGNEA